MVSYYPYFGKRKQKGEGLRDIGTLHKREFSGKDEQYILSEIDRMLQLKRKGKKR